MINKEYLKKLVLYQFGSMRNLSHELNINERTVYGWFGNGTIPIHKLELILNKIDIDIDKDKLFILERN